jgi:hypothetical protein
VAQRRNGPGVCWRTSAAHRLPSSSWRTGTCGPSVPWT